MVALWACWTGHSAVSISGPASIDPPPHQISVLWRGALLLNAIQLLNLAPTCRNKTHWQKWILFIGFPMALGTGSSTVSLICSANETVVLT